MGEETFTVYGGYPHDFDQLASNVGPGWKKLLRQLVDELHFLGWSGDYQQIKEKFGTLRFYFTNDCPSSTQQNLAFHAVDHADVMSGQTCEQCGRYGKLRGKGWYYTSCKEHAKEGDLEDWEKLDEGK